MKPFSTPMKLHRIAASAGASGFALLAVALVSSCRPLPPPPDPATTPPPATAKAPLTDDPAIVAATLAATLRESDLALGVVTPASACPPAVDAWKLDTSWHPTSASPGSTIIAEKKYCRYQWSGGPTVVPGDRLAMFKGAGFAGFAIDRPVLRGFAPPALGTDTKKAALDTYRLFARGHDPKQRYQPWTTRPAPKPNDMPIVAVIDTVQGVKLDQDPPPADSGEGHGYAVAQVAADMHCRNLAGSDARCDDTIKTYRALFPNPVPRLPAMPADQQPPPEYKGTLTQLVSAIDDALRDQQADPRGRKMVINLSLGWQEDPALEPQQQAVKDKLREAVCTGKVIVVAASGNKGAGGGAGPILPAKWETVRLNPDARCKGDRAQPLLYAASGTITSEDVGLPSARPLSQARLAAPALHVLAAAPKAPDQMTPIFSGTSMAAATVSGIVAAAWSFVPGRTVHSLMEDLAAQATRLDGETGVHHYQRNAAGKVESKTRKSKDNPLVADAGASAAATAEPEFLKPRSIDFCVTGAGSPCPAFARRLSLCAALKALRLKPECGDLDRFDGLPKDAMVPAGPNAGIPASPDPAPVGPPNEAVVQFVEATRPVGPQPSGPRCQFCWLTITPTTDPLQGFLNYPNYDDWMRVVTYQYSGSQIGPWHSWTDGGTSFFYSENVPTNTVAAEVQWWFYAAGAWNVVYESVWVY